VLKTIDVMFDSLEWEFVAGKKRLYVGADASQFRKDANGNRDPNFDPNNDYFYYLPPDSTGNTDGKVKDESGVLRIAEHMQGLNNTLDMLSMKCGLGETYYKFDGGIAATATQVISENSTLYRNIKKHEILLEDALVNILYAVVYAHREFTNVQIEDVKKEDIKISFDDSIIEDKGAELDRDKGLVASGLMSRVEFRMRWFNEDEDTARKNVLKFFRAEEISRYAPLLSQGAITPEEYVKECFPDKSEQEQDDIIRYIKEHTQTSPFDDMIDLYAGVEGENDET